MTDIKAEVIKRYKQLLPDVKSEAIEQAIDECYYKGITEQQLSKDTYAYLYPVNEPSLWSG